LPGPGRAVPVLGAVAGGGDPAGQPAEPRAREPAQGLPRRPRRPRRAHRRRARGHDGRPAPAALDGVGGQAGGRRRRPGCRAAGHAGGPRPADARPRAGRRHRAALPPGRRAAGRGVGRPRRRTPHPRRAQAAGEGEFRIHEEWGGTAELVEAGPEELEVAAAALATLPTTPAYARVDLLYDAGRPRVVEVELVEPYLWFELAPAAADALAAELVGSLARRG